MQCLQLKLKYCDDDPANCSYQTQQILMSYEESRCREQDKYQQLLRSRRLIDQMMAVDSRAMPAKLPELSKAQQKQFDRIEIMMMHKKPIFKVAYSTQRRNIPYQYEQIARGRVILEKLCNCCGNVVKKHCCKHSICEKPCKIQQKKQRAREKQNTRQLEQPNQPDLQD